MKRLWCLSAVLAGAVGVWAVVSADISPIDQMVATEQAFSFYAGRNGMKLGFLLFLDDDSIVFRPGPTSGKRWAETIPDTTGKLVWEPTFARISQRGDMGVTSGPWEFTPRDTTQPHSHGHFLSVWKRQTIGAQVEQMRVVLDAGVSHAKPDSIERPDFKGDPIAGERILLGAERERERATLVTAERQLAERAARGSFASALAPVASPDLRVFREGMPPRVGMESARAALPDSAAMRWTPKFVDMAQSADFGYAYGVATSRRGAQVDSTSYARVWQRGGDGRWRVIAEWQTSFKPRSS